LTTGLFGQFNHISKLHKIFCTC